MNDRTHSFGYWLRRRRKALDLTQEELARNVSCSRFAIRKIEADERRPSRRLAERLADKLGITAEERAAFIDAARAVRSAGRLDVDREPLAAPKEKPSQAPMVGRRDEYGLLLALLARLTAGTGHVVLIEGEPGIGKSRLMGELAAYTQERRICTLATRCYEIERAMAYQPVIDLATQAVEAASESALRAIAPLSLAEIAALVPALAERVAVPAVSSDFPEARQARLFRAIVQLLDALAEGRQVVVLVDDIQWADDASVQLLHYLARQAARRPLLLLCAYRDEDVYGDQRLGALVAALRAEPHARHMRLARLDLAATQTLIEGFGDPALAERLYRETEGNPFFLTSLLQAVRAGEIDIGRGGNLPLPDALRAAVRARLAHVPVEARSALDVAAVLGRHFDFDTLLGVTRESEEQLVRALDILVRRRLLREDALAGCYDFSHDKLREVAYLEIGAARRMLLHRAVAEALEHSGEGDARLAEHYERAHVWSKALRHMVLAGERSQKLFAMRDALHWFDRAVALAEVRPDSLEGFGLIELHELRGAARAQAGQTDGAASDIRRVIDAARSRGQREKVRDALIQLGMTYRRADRYDQASACLNEALAESRAMHDEQRAAETLYHLGTVAWSEGRNGQAIEFHSEAVAICERLGLKDLAAVQAYHGRGEAHFNNLEPQPAIDCFERSIELAQGIGDKSYECENLMMVGYACTGYQGLADYRCAEAKFAAALEIAQRADLQWHMGPTLLGLDHVRACTGRYGEAWTGMSRTLHWLGSLGLTRYQLMAHDFMGLLLLELGQDEKAAELLERGVALAHKTGIRFWLPRIEANLAIARMRLGRLEVLRQLEAALELARENGERTQMARCLEGLAELALRRDAASDSLAYAGQLLAMSEAGGLDELAARARLWRGESLAALGDRPAAIAELSAVARFAGEAGRLRLAFDAAVALARLGAPGAEAQRLAARVRESVAGSGLPVMLDA